MDLGGIRNIAGSVYEALGRSDLPKLLDDGLQALFPTGDDRHVGSPAGEGQGGRSADAARAAGHEGSGVPEQFGSARFHSGRLFTIG